LQPYVPAITDNVHSYSLSHVAEDCITNTNSIDYNAIFPDNNNTIYIQPNPTININAGGMQIISSNSNNNNNINNINNTINDDNNDDIQIISNNNNKRKANSIYHQPRAKRFESIETKVQQVNDNVCDMMKQQGLLLKRLDNFQNKHQCMSNEINSLKYMVENQKSTIDMLNTKIQSQQIILNSNNESMQSLRTLYNNLDNNCIIFKNTLEDSLSSQETTNTNLYKELRQLRTSIKSIRLSIDNLSS